jgi:hypothetical protein
MSEAVSSWKPVVLVAKHTRADVCASERRWNDVAPLRVHICMCVRSRVSHIGLLVSLLLGCGHGVIEHEDRPAHTASSATATVNDSPPPHPTRSPAALAALLSEYDAMLSAGADAPTLERARQVIDRTAGQRDAHMSRLYWYTDLEEAKRRPDEVANQYSRCVYWADSTKS